MWPFGSGSSDAADKLDPDLRVFLDENSASKPSVKSSSQLPRSHPQQDSKESQSPPDTSKPIVPPQSLFQDGRYASIWKTYQPPDGIAARSSNEKLRDLKEASEIRGASIERTAKENCVLEAEAEANCLSRGTWYNKLTMCRAETRALDRCTQLQTKFLRALGYLAVPGRSPQEE